jgi:Fur family ferric uptake transcriptional regulator
MATNKFQRNTRQRQGILQELRLAEDHPTAAELFARVRRQLPRISLATVYRNLERLSEAGLVRKLEFAGAETRFDAVVSPHYHVRCTVCGSVADVHEIAEDLVGERYARLAGYRVQGHRLEFHGVCPGCQDGDRR